MSYTIKEVAERMGVSIPTLRYYDKEGLMPFIHKKENGTRIFEEDDFGGLAVISCLKKSGLAIKDIRKYMELCDEGDRTLQQRRNLFIDRKKSVLEQMAELQAIMETIEYKISYYDQAIEAGTEQIHKKVKEGKR